MFETTFFDVIDHLRASRRPSDDFLKSIASRYGLENLVYFTINLPVKLNGPYYATTYSKEWVSHYFAEDYAKIDPALHKTLMGILPVDWSTIDKRAPQIRKFFGEAVEFGVGKQGLSFPIRGLNREIAVFSLAASLSEREWTSYSRHYMRDFQIIGHFIHSRMIESLGLDPSPNAPILPRELECLKWSAIGKSMWEIGEILGIAERTVKFHLDQARHKLNCVNIRHAVSKAVALGFVTIE
jgi:DNA-binding CsgD family transcriptional regulator